MNYVLIIILVLLPGLSYANSLLGSWVGCDGRVVEFSENGENIVGRYTSLGKLGNIGFTIGEEGYKTKKRSEGRYEGQVKWRVLFKGETEKQEVSWKPNTISISGDQYKDTGSDECSNNMTRQAPTKNVGPSGAESSSGSSQFLFVWRVTREHTGHASVKIRKKGKSKVLRTVQFSTDSEPSNYWPSLIYTDRCYRKQDKAAVIGVREFGARRSKYLSHQENMNSTSARPN